MRAATIAQISSYGQTPKQLFLKPHVRRRAREPTPLATLVERFTCFPLWATAGYVRFSIADFIVVDRLSNVSQRDRRHCVARRPTAARRRPTSRADSTVVGARRRLASLGSTSARQRSRIETGEFVSLVGIVFRCNILKHHALVDRSCLSWRRRSATTTCCVARRRVAPQTAR